jgi:GTPase SAR1 family protein
MLPNPAETFRMLVVSPSNSGKSNLIKNLITRPEFAYGNYYESNIFIFSQTIKVDSIWTDLTLPSSNLYDEYSEPIIQNIMHFSKQTPKGVLIILDDMITSEKAVNNKKTNLLKQLFFQGRHYKVSIILVSQKMKSIPSSLRVNSTHLICFDLRNKKEESDFLDENCGIDNVEEKYRTATSERYHFLYVNKMTGKAYHNFEVEL